MRPVRLHEAIEKLVDEFGYDVVFLLPDKVKVSHYNVR